MDNKVHTRYSHQLLDMLFGDFKMFLLEGKNQNSYLMLRRPTTPSPPLHRPSPQQHPPQVSLPLLLSYNLCDFLVWKPSQADTLTEPNVSVLS